MAGQHHHPNYLLIFVALCGLTLLSIVTDVVKIENKLVLAVLVLSVASAKALFVMMYFMHLKFEGKWKYVLLAPTTILAIGLPLALMPDIGLHYYSARVGPAVAAEDDEDEHHESALPAGLHDR